MIKLKEGQKVLGEDGNLYLIEKGDLIESKLKESYNYEELDAVLNANKVSITTIWVGLLNESHLIQIDVKSGYTLDILPKVINISGSNFEYSIETNYIDYIEYFRNEVVIYTRHSVARIAYK